MFTLLVIIVNIHQIYINFHIGIMFEMSFNVVNDDLTQHSQNDVFSFCKFRFYYYLLFIEI
jgi:hypothetical protein